MKKLLIFLVLISISVIIRGDIQPACEGKIDKYQYELNTLYNISGANGQTITDKNGNTYYYSVCHVYPLSQCEFVYDTTPAICQKDSRTPPQYHGLGTLSQTNWTAIEAGKEDKGFHLWWTTGGEPSPPPARQSDVIYNCLKGSGTGTLEFVEEDPVHFYTFAWTSQYVCPTKKGGDGGGGDDDSGISGGWIFIFIILGIFFLYFVIGLLVKKFAFGAEGIDIIPNVTFWKALPGLVVDGHKFVFGSCLRVFKKGGYNEM